MNTEQNHATIPTNIASEEAAMLLQGELADGLRNRIGLAPRYANEWAAQLTEYLRLRLGAQQVYIPAPSKAERDKAIAREFDGKNMADVMRRYDIGRSQVYEIVRRQRAQRG